MDEKKAEPEGGEVVLYVYIYICMYMYVFALLFVFVCIFNAAAKNNNGFK